MIDPQRLRDLADALQGCEWEVPLGSEQLCRDAAEELERLRAENEALTNGMRLLSEDRNAIADWASNVVVYNFLRDYRNQCFQLQGMYDGSMSEDCKALFAKDEKMTAELIAWADEVRSEAAKGGA